MSRLFLRTATITAYHATVDQLASGSVPNGTVAVTTLSKMRMEFSIEKSNGSDPNKADLTITNLNPASRTEFQTKPLTVVIDAGYNGVNSHLFTGDLRYGYSKLDDTEWSTVLQLGDGDRSYRYARVGRSYTSGVDVLTVLRDASRSMGFDLPPNVEASTDLRRQFASGYTLSGSAATELTRLLAPYGYQWSIQNGALQILRADEVRADSIALISADNGLVGSPEWSTPDAAGKQPTLKLNMKLRPSLMPGQKVQVQSRAINGVFRIEKLTHKGDTFGSDDDWNTEAEAKPL